MERDDRKQAIAALQYGIEAGLSHIDTAEIYGDGAVEELVGEAIAGYRADVFLASKVHPERATYAGTLLACEKSLKRLRTDRLDLYMIHWRGTLPLEETIRALEVLKTEGKILAWGLSNFDVADIERVIEIAGNGTVACNQVLYNLAERDAEHLIQPVCERHKIAFVGYSPLGSGNFPSPGSWRGQLLASISAAHGVSPRAVALAFLARRPGAFLVVKSARQEHIKELALAKHLVLSAVELEAIASAFSLGPPKSRLPTG